MFEYYHIPDELSPLAETLLIDRLVEVSRPNKEAAKEYLNKIIEHGIQNKQASYHQTYYASIGTQKIVCDCKH